MFNIWLSGVNNRSAHEIDVTSKGLYHAFCETLRIKLRAVYTRSTNVLGHNLGKSRRAQSEITLIGSELSGGVRARYSILFATSLIT